MEVTIKEIGKLVRSLERDEEVVDWEISSMTKPGENYGSIIRRILFKIRDKKSGKERNLDTVCKLLPICERTQKIFNSEISFKNEFLYYEKILPILDTFMKNKGIKEGADFSSTFHGGRLSLTDKIVDENAIILMENLKSVGYVLGEKRRGLGLEESKFVLHSLAKFHTSSLAIRFQNNATFEKHFASNFFSFLPSEDLVDIVKRNISHYIKQMGFTEKEVETVECACENRYKKNISPDWGTMIHFDCWVNNILIKYNEHGKPIHAILLDFQFCEYGSPLNDVAFFLLSSIHQENFEKSVDHLLDYYYEQFIYLLKRFDMDTSKYTRPCYDKEVAMMVKNYELWHTLWMLFPMFDTKFQKAEDLETIGDGILPWSEEHLQKIKRVIKLCFDKGWL